MMSYDTHMQSAPTEALDRGPGRSVERSQIRALVEARIDLPPDMFRSFFMLGVVEEMGADEVAEVPDIGAATVWTPHFFAGPLLRPGLAQELNFSFEEAFSFVGERCYRIVAGVMAGARAEGLRQQD